MTFPEIARPYVELKARNLRQGVVNLKWERLYTGGEPDSPLAAVLPADGSLIRLRVAPAADGRKLYRQRVINLGPASDFSRWEYLGHLLVMAVAACSLGTEVSLFWVKDNGEISRQRSTDNGETWLAVDYPGWAPSGAVGQMAAACKPNGDLALFFNDGNVLYVIKRTGGDWQARTAWNKTTGLLSGVAAVYADGDWKLLVSGQDTAGNFKVWSLVYGDGGEYPAGSWSDLKEIATAPSDGGFRYGGVFLDRPDQYRGSFSEIYTGAEFGTRVYQMHTLPGTSFLENRWREPEPGLPSSEYGLALAHHSGHIWMTCPGGVWRADLAAKELDLSADILGLKVEMKPEDGRLTVELRNDRRQYAAPGKGALEVLEEGCRIDLDLVGRTASGGLVPETLSFILQGLAHVSSPGRSTLELTAVDGWNLLENWRARYQLRWNQPDSYGGPVQEASVKEILAQMLARAGIRLETGSQSADIAGFYPDFTVHAEDTGLAVVRRLLSFVPDVLFLEGDTACLVNPREDDVAAFHYGLSHPLFAGRYARRPLAVNRVLVEGKGVWVDVCDWAEIARNGERLVRVEDLNIVTPAQAQARGAAVLRKAAVYADGGSLGLPVVSGQRIFDVVDITDARAGISALRRRVLSREVSFVPSRGEYEQVLGLGGV